MRRVNQQATGKATRLVVPPAGLYAEQPDAAPALAPPAGTGIIDGPLRPAILRLALPAVGTTLFQVLFNVTDTFWVGRTLGPDALAAVSLASYSVWVIVSIGELVGVGLTAVSARRHGEGDPESAARVAGTALVMALVLGVVIAIGGLLSLPAIFRLMNAQGASDLHLAARSTPRLRVQGDLEPVKFKELDDNELLEMLAEIAPATKMKQYEQTGDVDFAYELAGVGRFRANYFRQALDGNAFATANPAK
jgi:hypothetical protein